MELEDFLQGLELETQNCELKDCRVRTEKVVRELVAFGNATGGVVFVGLRESGGAIEKVQHIENLAEWEENVNQCLVDRVDPPFDIEFQPVEYDNKIVVRFEVDELRELRTYDPGNGKPCIPRRSGTTTSYLDGSGIDRYYRDQLGASNPTEDESYNIWTDEIRKLAHLTVYTYTEADFSESKERKQFAEEVRDVGTEIEGRLKEPHRELTDETKAQMQALVNEWRELDELKISATMGPISFSTLTDSRPQRGSYSSRYPRSSSPSSTRSNNRSKFEPSYIGDSPDEVERKFRAQATLVNEAAHELEDHLS